MFNMQEWLTNVANYMLLELANLGIETPKTPFFIKPSMPQGKALGKIYYGYYDDYYGHYDDQAPTQIYITEVETPFENLIDTIYHEICHFVAFPFGHSGHGKKWKELMRLKGAVAKTSCSITESAYNFCYDKSVFEEFVTRIKLNFPHEIKVPIIFKEPKEPKPRKIKKKFDDQLTFNFFIEDLGLKKAKGEVQQIMYVVEYELKEEGNS